MTFHFEVPAEFAPALRAAIEEYSASLAQRLERPWAPKTERALTHAVSAMGGLRAAINAQVPKSDPHFAAPPESRRAP